MARILVVDDDRRVLDILLRALGRFGHDITPARDAEAGLDTLRNGGRFDVIVSDVRMPGQSGLDLLREARTLAPGVPVILMSGIWMSDEREEAESLGARSILTKPVDLGVLESAIALAVAQPHAPAHAEAHSPQAYGHAGGTGGPAAGLPPAPPPHHPGNGHSLPPPQAAAVAAPSITRSGTAIPVVTMPVAPAHAPALAVQPPPPPAAPPPPPPPPPPSTGAAEAQAVAAALAAAVDPRVAPASVLVVERDVTVRRLLAYCLAREGYRVVAVSDAGAAAARLAAEGFDAAIVDASEVVAIPPGPYVLCLHEPGAPAEAVEALEGGADALVERPLEPEVLFAQLRAGLRRRAASRGHGNANGHGHAGEGRRGPNGGSGARPQGVRPAG